jgi:hypothetical protein
MTNQTIAAFVGARIAPFADITNCNLPATMRAEVRSAPFFARIYSIRVTPRLLEIDNDYSK